MPTNVRPESPAAPLRARAYRWAAAIWALVALVFTGQNVTSALVRGRRIDWQWDVAHELLYWALWALSTPFIARAVRRRRLEPGSGAAPWLAHAAMGLVLVVVQVAATYLLHGLGLRVLGRLPAGGLADWLRAREPAAVVLCFTGTLYYWLIVGGYHALAWRRLYLIERAQAAEASLDALRAQLQPHFLFNTLNSVTVLAEESPAAARKVLLRLSELLRTVLRQDPRDEVPLTDELAFLAGYLEIQQVRFDERLRVTIEAADDASRGLVPALVLQPLVENAIRYAVEPRVEGGKIAVRATRSAGRLTLEVVDDGAGFEGPGERNGAGIGLANTRARLERLYGDRHEFRIEPAAGGRGVAARIVLPYREA